ncbi:hypothetical protein KY290_003595 [Solanum tuberosum]|uniref:Uncharacterized protein n=1 Tax=Solanum tuberosum TaxID=4113 RepID=A0ABQ7WTA9_SOLTU|nr:hypothetical protein KY284_003746 [Solanum tuberosum]KAH0767727.1 hypothetical protein KY285_003598 [Solanum tuberosum]KAH0783997.1 hypothetical protein KY290_003595 [Solanum tuberosum]
MAYLQRWIVVLGVGHRRGRVVLYSNGIAWMNPAHEPLRTRMVTIPDPYLQVWWKFMNNRDKRKVQRHIGNLPSLMEIVAWPGLIGTMVKFWDSDNMVFWFREVEMTPTIEEVMASYESVDMCNKRKRQPDTDILFPKTWDFAEMKKKLTRQN